MNRMWLTAITYGFAILAGAFLLLGGYFALNRPSEIPPREPIKERSTLPPGAFNMQQQAYDAIGEPLLNLKRKTVTMQLPDLKQQLIFTGKNNRPDAQKEKLLLNFTLPGSKQPVSISPNEKLYLMFDRKQGGKWAFSPKNQETSLWFKAAPDGEMVDVSVTMLNERGETVNKPEANAKFTLKEKAGVRNGKTWEIGKWRVDATLLSRQKARWYGKDLFLEKHGGNEFANTVGKERIDFLEGEAPYSIYVKEGDFFIWKGDHWSTPEGVDSANYPLLLVKKIGDRVMNLELWDVEGKRKVNLNVLRSGDVKVPNGLMQQFKFVGAKTRSQFLFEVGKERITIRPKDWLVFTKTGWTKLSTAEDIDNFVTRKTTGPLFVVDTVVRKGDGQVIIGTLFNTSRTDVQQIEVPLQQGRSSKVVESEKKENKNSGMKHELRPPQASRPRQRQEVREEIEVKDAERIKQQPPRLREPRMQNGQRMPLAD